MGSRTAGVIADLLAVLRRNHATVDLSTVDATNRVLCPALTLLPPGTAPLLVLSAPSVRPAYDDSGMGRYRNSTEFEWTLFLQAKADDPAVRGLQAIEAASDLIAAVEDAHRDPAYSSLIELTELLMTLEDVMGDELEDAPGLAVATGRITCVDYPTRGI